MSNTLVFCQSAGELGYGPIAVLLGMVIVTGVAILLLTHFIPKYKRSGARKDETYESGVEAIGDARRRFNVRFYMVAMLFLLFDVELIFLYPWAIAFYDSLKTSGDAVWAGFLFWNFIIFFGILAVGFVYDWAKGVFRYD